MFRTETWTKKINFIITKQRKFSLKNFKLKNKIFFAMF